MKQWPTAFPAIVISVSFQRRNSGCIYTHFLDKSFIDASSKNYRIILAASSRWPFVNFYYYIYYYILIQYY